MSPIWKSPLAIEKLNERSSTTPLFAALGIRFTAFGENWLEAALEVGPNVHQPEGLLHGGISVVLAETVGSVASLLVVDSRAQFCVGVEVNANHIKSMRSGLLIARATPIHLGKSLHVWDVRLRDEKDQTICAARLTTAILARKN